MLNDLQGQTPGTGRTVTQTKAFWPPSPCAWRSAAFPQKGTRLSQCHPDK